MDKLFTVNVNLEELGRKKSVTTVISFLLEWIIVIIEILVSNNFCMNWVERHLFYSDKYFTYVTETKYISNQPALINSHSACYSLW